MAVMQNIAKMQNSANARINAVGQRALLTGQLCQVVACSAF